MFSRLSSLRTSDLFSAAKQSCRAVLICCNSDSDRSSAARRLVSFSDATGSPALRDGSTLKEIIWGDPKYSAVDSILWTLQLPCWPCSRRCPALSGEQRRQWSTKSESLQRIRFVFSVALLYSRSGRRVACNSRLRLSGDTACHTDEHRINYGA